MSTAEEKKVEVTANYDFGKGFDFEAAKGLNCVLWGVTFTCDGDKYVAKVPKTEAAVMKKAKRVS